MIKNLLFLFLLLLISCQKKYETRRRENLHAIKELSTKVDVFLAQNKVTSDTVLLSLIKFEKQFSNTYNCIESPEEFLLTAKLALKILEKQYDIYTQKNDLNNKKKTLVKIEYYVLRLYLLQISKEDALIHVNTNEKIQQLTLDFLKKDSAERTRILNKRNDFDL